MDSYLDWLEIFIHFWIDFLSINHLEMANPRIDTVYTMSFANLSWDYLTFFVIVLDVLVAAAVVLEA
jgi:hypothetical protein